MSDADFTLLWAKLVLTELNRCGVQHVCIAPGSRSTPLVTVASALRDQQKIQIHTHFDERGLGFYALGLAKSTQQAVAIVVTSGTAVANLLPAVAEAYLTKEKLVVLTADRPVELVGCGANQAIQQKGIFSSHTTDEIYLPAPNQHTPAAWLLSRIDDAMNKQNFLCGPIHINCPYAIPLYAGNYEASFPQYLAPLTHWLLDTKPFITHSKPVSNNCVAIEDNIWNKRGIIVVGAIRASDQVAVKAFALATGWPILTDIQSGLVSDWSGYDVWLNMPNVVQKFESLDIVIQFGSRLVSPSIESVLKYKYAINYFLIDEDIENRDPSHRSINYIHACATDWIKAQSFEAYSQCAESGWGDKLKYYSRKMLAYVEDESSSEIGLIQKIDALLPQQASLFLGNSTVIRLFNNFSRHSHPYVYANRGASGIDGLIASAVGIAQGKRDITEATCAIVGDISALHDLNSLALLAKIRRPFVLIISNNAGGAIFDRFPIEPHMEDLYQMHHNLNFEQAASMFGINYISLSDTQIFEESFTQAIKAKKATIIEYITPPKATDKITNRVTSKLKTMETLTLVKE